MKELVRVLKWKQKELVTQLKEEEKKWNWCWHQWFIFYWVVPNHRDQKTEKYGHILSQYFYIDNSLQRELRVSFPIGKKLSSHRSIFSYFAWETYNSTLKLKAPIFLVTDRFLIEVQKVDLLNSHIHQSC